MPFHDVAGNARVHNIIRRALAADRLPNSLIFGGPRGVGKRRTARLTAQALNCLSLKDDACGKCGPCRAIEVRGRKDGIGTFPDVQEIEIPEDKTEIGIDQMRILRKQAYLRPMTGRKRVFIVTSADTMDDEAANALLKILEEPPLFTHVILLAENPALLLPTIRSRCQMLTFLPVSDEEIEKALLDGGVSAERARILALICRGNIEKALEMDWEEIQAERGDAWQIFCSLADGSNPAALLHRFSKKRGEGTKRAAVQSDLAALLELLAAFGRDAVLLAEGGDPRLLINPDYEAELRAAAAGLGPERALRLVDLLHGAAASNDRNAHFAALITSLTAQWLRADAAL